MVDLNSLSDGGRKIQLKDATSINNAGNIVGVMGVTAKGDSEEHAFVLFPNVP